MLSLLSQMHARSVTAEVWSGSGLFTNWSVPLLTVTGRADNTTAVVFDNLAIDRQGTYVLRFSTVVVLASGQAAHVTTLTGPIAISGGTRRSAPQPARHRTDMRFSPRIADSCERRPSMLLAATIDGSNSTFQYSSPLWTDLTVFKNVIEGTALAGREMSRPSVDVSAAASRAEKSPAFFYPLRAVRLSFTYVGVTRCLWINITASSLRDLFERGTRLALRWCNSRMP
jgi:hypothetical protein